MNFKIWFHNNIRMSEENINFFGFRMFDRNENEIDLSEFLKYDVIVVVNCLNVDESKERAAYYCQLDKREKRVQILCLLGSKFFYDGHQDVQSLRLISYLREKTSCHNDVEDGLTFLIDNRAHNPGQELISYIGNNLTNQKVQEAVDKYLD